MLSIFYEADPDYSNNLCVKNMLFWKYYFPIRINQASDVSNYLGPNWYFLKNQSPIKS
jgi:hypothetical protein